MKKNEKKELFTGCILLAGFVLWTWLIQVIDVQMIGVNKTAVGFATVNVWFHRLTGVHMGIYHITDWLGLVPVFVCMIFGGIGFWQLVGRRSLFKVDSDLLVLGVYYMVVIFGYLIFEMIPINYRPILIRGVMEVSYPSSTTLLVLSVMPTLVFQVNRRTKSTAFQKTIFFISLFFSAFMVIGRLISGVHWLTDIIGAIFLSGGGLYIYKAVVLLCCK